MIFWLLVLLVAIALRRKRPTRALRLRYNAHNPVVAGRAMFRCGCLLSPDEVRPCAAHAALAEHQP